MTRFAAAFAFLLLGVAPVLAQPKPGTAQPDRLPFGTVYTGALVEGSLLVFEPGKNPDILIAVAAPEFIKLGRPTTEARQFGPGRDFICGSVEFTLDTS